MDDYISREKLIDMFCSQCTIVGKERCFVDCFDITKIRKLMPSADVQPVVYCKDCVNNYGTEHSPMCDFMDAHLYPNSYCSYGEMNQKKLEE